MYHKHVGSVTLDKILDVWISISQVKNEELYAS